MDLHSIRLIQYEKRWDLFHLLFRAVIGELDDETDSIMDLHNIRAEPLNPKVH